MYVVVEPNTIPVQQPVQYNKIINIKDVKQDVELELKSKKIIETELKNWKPATDAAIERNTRFLNRLRLQDGHESLDTR